jgi:hypothetical protein
MFEKANPDVDVPDDVLAHRILIEAGPRFAEELGFILTHQRLVLWIQAERRKAKRRALARPPS